MTRRASGAPWTIDEVRSRCELDPSTGCWLWLGARNDRGYGQAIVDGRCVYVHRLVYGLVVGPIPDGHEVDHVRERGCVHTRCCNPDHLEAVSPRENKLRGMAPSAIDYRNGSCRRGHPRIPGVAYRRKDRTEAWNCLECRRERRRLARAG